MVVFLLCSAFCAIAPDIPWLITARVVQGAGAALIIPQTFGLIRGMFAGSELAKALGTIGPVLALTYPMLQRDTQSPRSPASSLQSS